MPKFNLGMPIYDNSTETYMGMCITRSNVSNVNLNKFYIDLFEINADLIREANKKKTLLTIELIKEISPFSKQDLVLPFVETFNLNNLMYDLDTPNRISKYLANVMHETDALKTFEEYASGSAYEGKVNLGNVNKGDGIKYKGRGAMQTTGRYNYGVASKIIYGDEKILLENPQILLDPKQGTLASMIYWKKKDCGYLADNSSFEEVVRRINGRTNGLDSRKIWLSKILKAFEKADKKNTQLTTSQKYY